MNIPLHSQPANSIERVELDIAKEGIALLGIDFNLGGKVVITVKSLIDRGVRKEFTLSGEGITTVSTRIIDGNQEFSAGSSTANDHWWNVAPRYLSEVLLYVGFDVEVDTMKVWASTDPTKFHVIDEIRRQFLENISQFLNTNSCILKFDKFYIQYSGTDYDSNNVETFLKGGAGPTELHFRSLQIEPLIELNLSEIVQLDQWKKAKKLTIDLPFYMEVSYSYWKHFEESDVVVKKLDRETVKGIIAHARATPSFRSCTIRTLVDQDKSTICPLFDPRTRNEYIHESGVMVNINEKTFTFTPPEARAQEVERDEWEYEEFIEVTHQHATVKRVKKNDESDEIHEIKFVPAGYKDPNGSDWCRKEKRGGHDGLSTEFIHSHYMEALIQYENKTASERRDPLRRFEKIEVVLGVAPGDKLFKDWKGKLLEKWNKEFTTRNPRVEVAQFLIEFNGNWDDEDLACAYLRLFKPTELHFRSPKNEQRQLKLSTILETSQWQEAKKITICWPFWTGLSPEQWMHCDKTQLVLYEFPVATFKKIIECAGNRPEFVYCAIEIRRQTVASKLLQYIEKNFTHGTQNEYTNRLFKITVTDHFYLIQKK